MAFPVCAKQTRSTAYVTRNHPRPRPAGRINLGRAALVLCAIAMLAVGCTSSGGSSTASAGHVQPVVPPCAWSVAVNAGTIAQDNTLNYSNPDTGAAYWLTAFTVQPGLRITLTGRYPDSRYMSIQAYSSSGLPYSVNGVPANLSDYRITPDHGSVNPWQHPAAPGGGYTVTLSSAPSGPNAMPLAPAGTPAGTVEVLFYRVYLPVHGDPGQVPLPAVTFTVQGTSRRVPACPATSNPTGAAAQEVFRAFGVPAPSGQPAAATAPARPTNTAARAGTVVPFARYPATTGTPDSDTAYLVGGIVPPANGDVVLIRGKAPSAPSGDHPGPWPGGSDLRYWSVCADLAAKPNPVVVNRLPSGEIDEGCRTDTEISVGSDGYYTIAIGTEGQRQAILRVPGLTYLPLSSVEPAQAYKINFRNMLPSPGFRNAAQDAPASGSPSSAAAAMGPYYPQMSLCSLAALAAKGVKGCVRP